MQKTSELELTTEIFEEVEKRYSNFFLPLPESRFAGADPNKIIDGIFSKNRSFRFKSGAARAIVAPKIVSAVMEKRPIKIRVAWGYGKDRLFRDYDREHWFEPDMADIFSLSIVRILETNMNYPLEITMSSSWDRYLNINYYSVGKEPEKWFEDGLKKYILQFRELVGNLMPEVKSVNDSYHLARNLDLDMDMEVRSEYVKNEYRKLISDQHQMIRALNGSVLKHSATPDSSLERYLKERIAEGRYENYDFTVHFGRAVHEDKIQYKTVPNKKLSEIIPPWEAKGSFLFDGEHFEELMATPLRLQKLGLPNRKERFRIGSQKVGGWIYLKK